MNKTTFSHRENVLTVTRQFNAPIELVWRAWTEAELLDQWWAPAPWKSETKHMEFKEGGYRLYVMVGPEGEKHWGKTDYETIVHLEKITGSDSFCDENGNVNPQAPVAQIVDRFSSISQHTEVVVTCTYPSESDLKTVIEMGMKEGLDLAFQQLDKALKRIS